MDIHLILFIGSIFAVLAFGLIRHLSKPKAFRLVSLIALLIYLAPVLYITVFSRQPVLETRWNIIPFQGYEYNTFYFSFLPNMLLFIPIGLFLNGILPKCKIGYIILAGMGISLCIELIQLFIHVGICDIDDFFANSAGGILGALAGKGMMRVIRGK